MFVMPRTRALLVGAALCAGSRMAWSAPCAAVTGDPGLAAQISDLLHARGVASCPDLEARVERLGTAVAVRSDRADGTEPRVVGDPETAATVIESWARADLADPLLTVRVASATDDGVGVHDAMGPREIVEHATLTPLHPIRPSSRGVQLFAAFETSFASDATSWVGPVIGACVMIGPVCAAARVRVSSVVDGPGLWEHALERRGNELLIGGDIPFELGKATFTPGFGGGIGMIGTHVASQNWTMHSETGGLRADVHAALSYSLTTHLALDVTMALDVTQAAHVETNTTMQFPDEPWLLARVGVGLHYGAR